MRSLPLAVAAGAATFLLPLGTASAASELVHAREGVRAVDSLGGVQVFSAAAEGDANRLYRRVGGTVSRVPGVPAGVDAFDLGRDRRGRLVVTVCVRRGDDCRWRRVVVRTGRVTRLRFATPAGCTVGRAAEWRGRIAYAVRCARARRVEGLYYGTVRRSRKVGDLASGRALQGFADVDLFERDVVAVVHSGASRTVRDADDVAELWALRRGRDACRRRIATSPLTTQDGLAAGLQAHLGPEALLFSSVTTGRGAFRLGRLAGCEVEDARTVESPDTHSSIALDGGSVWFAGGDAGRGLYRQPVT